MQNEIQNYIDEKDKIEKEYLSELEELKNNHKEKENKLINEFNESKKKLKKDFDERLQKCTKKLNDFFKEKKQQLIVLNDLNKLFELKKMIEENKTENAKSILDVLINNLIIDFCNLTIKNDKKIDEKKDN